jgi:hypothetical protein
MAAKIETPAARTTLLWPTALSGFWPLFVAMGQESATEHPEVAKRWFVPDIAHIRRADRRRQDDRE